nr:hypothetical protein [Tanacetum cinerariifolium]
YGIDAADAGQVDGAGRQAGVLVGVVGRVFLQVHVEHALNAKIAVGVDHGGVGLQLHAALEAVEVHGRNAGALVGVLLLLGFYDASQGAHLNAREAELLAGRVALGRPEFLVLRLHALHEVGGRGIPVELVGVRNKHREHRRGVKTQAFGIAGATQQRINLFGMGINLLGKLGG